MKIQDMVPLNRQTAMVFDKMQKMEAVRQSLNNFVRSVVDWFASCDQHTLSELSADDLFYEYGQSVGSCHSADVPDYNLVDELSREVAKVLGVDEWLFSDKVLQTILYDMAELSQIFTDAEQELIWVICQELLAIGVDEDVDSDVTTTIVVERLSDPTANAHWNLDGFLMLVIDLALRANDSTQETTPCV